jgi:hypothetical protein
MTLSTYIFGSDTPTSAAVVPFKEYSDYTEVATDKHRPRHVEPPYETLPHNHKTGMKLRETAHNDVFTILGKGLSSLLNFAEDTLGKAPADTFRDADNPYYNLHKK